MFLFLYLYNQKANVNVHFSINAVFWAILHAFLSSAVLFQNQLLRKIISESANSLDPVQARHSVRPDLGPNYLQKLSADTTGM